MLVDPRRLSDIAALRGHATARATSGEHWSAEVVLAAARRVCTPRQLEAVAHTLDGHGTAEVGRRMGVSAGAVDCLLWGNVYRGERRGGAVAKIKAEIERVGVPTEPVSPGVMRGIAPSWYRDALRPPDPGLFAALGLLALIVHLSDSRGRVSYNDLSAHVPPQALGHLLPRLRVAGYVAVDGPVVCVMRVPSDD
jgi:hypothetical protein